MLHSNKELSWYNKIKETGQQVNPFKKPELIKMEDLGMIKCIRNNFINTLKILGNVVKCS